VSRTARPRRLADWDPEEPHRIEREGIGMLVVFILISVVLAAIAQLTLKHGMTKLTNHGAVPLNLKDPLGTIRRILATPAVWGGLSLFVASAAAWLIVLSKASLSFAYPFVSLTYVLILLFDRFVLDEPVSLVRWSGVALIMGGIFLVSRTGSLTGA
jgi:drug/metabolite transporter (DMT)-like permease